MGVMVGVALGCTGWGVIVAVGVGGTRVGEAVGVSVLFSSVRSAAGVAWLPDCVTDAYIASGSTGGRGMSETQTAPHGAEGER